MKKLVLMLAVLLLAAPAMATVTISAAAGVDPNTVVVSFSQTGEPELVRAIALDVIVNDPNVVIGAIDCVNADYGIYPGSISIDASGTVTDWGSCAGAGLGSNTVATEQGSLYVGAANEPAQSGDLFIITLAGCTQDLSGDVTVSITEDALRGGVVLEDPAIDPTVVLPGAVTVSVGVCVDDEPPCPCLGDVADQFGAPNPDGQVDLGDFNFMIGALAVAGAPYVILDPAAAGVECADIADQFGAPNPDGQIDLGDFNAMIGHLAAVGPPYIAPCVTLP